jgi:hypothetical protein
MLVIVGVRVGRGVFVRVGISVLVGVGVVVGVAVLVGVLVGVAVLVGGGKLFGVAGTLRLQAESLKEIEKPKLLLPKLSGAEVR